jgi:hypothetical protein
MNCPESILNLSWIYIKILRHGLRAQVVRSNICFIHIWRIYFLHVRGVTKLKLHRWGIPMIISNRTSIVRESTKYLQIYTRNIYSHTRPVWSSKQASKQQQDPSFDKLVQVELIPNNDY